MAVDLEPSVDEVLFGQGLTVDDYWLEKTPVSEVICFRNQQGRSFDLHVGSDNLWAAAKNRLRELGVRVVEQS